MGYTVFLGLREGDSGHEELDPETQLMPHELENEDDDVAEEEDEGEPRGMHVSIALVLFGIALLKFGADYVVNNSVEIATALGISERIIGLTVIALGTCLPELVTSVVAAFKGNTDIAVGNVVGSNITNVLLVMGVPALFSPIVYAFSYNIDFALLATLQQPELDLARHSVPVGEQVAVLPHHVLGSAEILLHSHPPPPTVSPAGPIPMRKRPGQKLSGPLAYGVIRPAWAPPGRQAPPRGQRPPLPGSPGPPARGLAPRGGHPPPPAQR